MIRDRVIKTAKILYAQYGIKRVNIEHIASDLFISTETLYTEFRDEEELLSVFMEQEINALYLSVEMIKKRAESSLEVVVLSCIEQLYYIKSYSPVFFSDLKFYAGPDKQWRRYRQDFRKMCMDHFEKGVIDGDFLSDQNYELISAMITEQSGSFNIEFQETMILTIIRGACTETGRNKLRRFMWQR
ncbi:MAG: TetR/AcrR family transcriptional regulator [Tannerella sp.]|jgi:AcrR family transcriptional regulator|nr:TetR/AcrR family transcriptional regulator [Tannerella sp.]